MNKAREFRVRGVGGVGSVKIKDATKGRDKKPKQLEGVIKELVSVMNENGYPVPVRYKGVKDELAVLLLDTRQAFTRKIEEGQDLAVRMGATNELFYVWKEFELSAFEFADTLPEEDD